MIFGDSWSESQWLPSGWDSKKHIMPHKIYIRGSWWYVDVWHGTLSDNMLFTVLPPVIHSLRQTIQSDVQLMSKSFFWTDSFQQTGWISSPRLNHLKQLQLKQHNSTSYSIKAHFWTCSTVAPRIIPVYIILLHWFCKSSFSAPVPPTQFHPYSELKKTVWTWTEELMRCWYEHEWTKHSNKAAKLKFM